MKRIGRVLLVCCIALVACGTGYGRPKELPIPRGSIRLTNEYYAEWWKQIEECSGKTADYASVRFYALNDQGRGIPFKGELALALAYPNKHAIVLSLGTVMDSLVVRHEMLHLIASPGDHSPLYYLDKCAHLVSCSSHCQLNLKP